MLESKGLNKAESRLAGVIAGAAVAVAAAWLFAPGMAAAAELTPIASGSAVAPEKRQRHDRRHDQAGHCLSAHRHECRWGNLELRLRLRHHPTEDVLLRLRPQLPLPQLDFGHGRRR